MKKAVFAIAIVLLLAGCILTVMSCKTEPEDNPLIGTWANGDNLEIYTFTTTEVNRYSYYDFEHEQLSFHQTGSYELDSNWILIYFGESSTASFFYYDEKEKYFYRCHFEDGTPPEDYIPYSYEEATFKFTKK